MENAGRIWYAVQNDTEDDWGTGSFDLDDAKVMLQKRMENYPDALIAAIENDVCIGELRLEDGEWIWRT